MTRHARPGDLYAGLGDLRVLPGKVRCQKVGTTSIQLMFKKQSVSSLHQTVPQLDATTKQKYGYEAPALAYSTHKPEGMHEIGIVEMNPKPIETISASSIVVSLPEILLSVLTNESTASRASSKDAQSPTTSDLLIHEIYHPGMQLNPHWIENNGQKPKNGELTTP